MARELPSLTRKRNRRARPFTDENNELSAQCDTETESGDERLEVTSSHIRQDDGEASLWETSQYSIEMTISDQQTEILQDEIQSVTAEDGNNMEHFNPNSQNYEDTAPRPSEKCKAAHMLGSRRNKYCVDKPPIDAALVIVHNQLVALESRFQKDLHRLESKYTKEFYAPLLQLRNRLLEASKALNNCDQLRTERCGHIRMPCAEWDCCDNFSIRRISDIGIVACNLFDQCAKVMRAEEFGEDTWFALKHMLCRISEALQLRSRYENCWVQPHNFWYYVFQRSDPLLSGMLGVNDAEFLGYVRDVRVNLFNTSWPDCCELATEFGIMKRYPPFLRKRKQPRLSLSARHSKSYDIITGVIEDGTASDQTSDTITNSCESEPTTSKSRQNGVIGFELRFEFYPNNLIQNSLLRKRYVIDVMPRKDDYVRIKKHKNFIIPMKVGLSASDGCDEQSSDCAGRGNRFRRKRSRDRYHHILDYNGPRLVAVEGSTIRWKCGAKRILQSGCHFRCSKPCCVPCDVSANPTDNNEGDESLSFLDFFGWNWDIYRNRIMMNDALKLVDLDSEEINAFIDRDYQAAMYIRDYVIPRAFDIYRRCQRLGPEAIGKKPGFSGTRSGTMKNAAASPCNPILSGKATHQMQSVSVGKPVTKQTFPAMSSSSEDMSQMPSPKKTNCRNLCVPLPQPINLARNYDDVDDIIEIPHEIKRKQTSNSSYPSESLVSSGKRFPEITYNVKSIADRANVSKSSDHQIVIGKQNYKSTSVNDPTHVTKACETKPQSHMQPSCLSQSFVSDDRNVRPAPMNCNSTDDDNWIGRTTYRLPTGNRPDKETYRRYRRYKWTNVRRRQKEPEMVNSKVERNGIPSLAKRKKITFKQSSPCPSDEGMGGTDACDAQSSSDDSQRMETRSDRMTPSTSDEEIAKPDDYPFDIHSLDDSDCNQRIVDSSLMDHSNRDHLPCSFGPKPELTDGIADKQDTENEEEEKTLDGESVEFNSDSEAPMDTDHQPCRQQ